MKLIFKRGLAYFIDITLVSLLIYMLSNMPINPNYKEIKKINKEINLVTEKYNNILKESDKIFKMDEKDIESFDKNTIKIVDKKYTNKLEKIISDKKIEKAEKQEYINEINKDYQNETIDLMYNLKRISYFQIIISIVISFLYFVLFQYIMSGETLGRKLTKTKLISIDKKKITYFNLIVRWLILYGIYSMIIESLVLYSLNSKTYLNIMGYLNSIFSFIQMLILFTVIIRPDGRGIHDILAKTKVIELKRE